MARMLPVRSAAVTVLPSHAPSKTVPMRARLMCRKLLLSPSGYDTKKGMNLEQADSVALRCHLCVVFDVAVWTRPT